jgi:ubiquinone/menaquinone biosynthesis C-methylase UbiE
MKAPQPMVEVAASSNTRKYSSRNPLLRLVLGRFLGVIKRLISTHNPRTILDAGCGEGFVLKELDSGLSVGVDVSYDALLQAKVTQSGAVYCVGDVMDLPFKDGCFEMVLCFEVLEHLSRPELALKELARVCGGSCILSVPNTIYFRLANILRLKNLPSLGEDPDHIQHWTRGGFAEFVGDRMETGEPLGVFPWTLIVCHGGSSERRNPP